MTKRTRCVAFLLMASVVASRAIAAQAKPQPPPSDSVRLLSHVVEAEQRFFAMWQKAWLPNAFLHGMTAGQEPLDEIGSPRYTGYVRCQRYGPWLGAQRPIGTILISAATPRSMCPSWKLVIGLPEPDMAVVIDSGLTAAKRATVVAARDSLLAVLDSATRALPGDGWVSGQRVRFLLDQAYSNPDDLSRASLVARDCRAAPWWCTALTGFVLYRQGAVAAADSAFLAATSLVPAAERCAWMDFSALLDVAGGRAYAAQSCATRMENNAQVWWLADPLWTDPGNERRAEHYARKVSLLLRSTLPKDERYNWLRADGGDAAREMVMRYGWPSVMIWAGPVMDPAADAPPPHTTNEYFPGRPHVVPGWNILMNPLTAQNSDWALHPPDSMRAPQPVVKDGVYQQPQEFRRAVTRMLAWWPAEHFARTRSLIQLPDGQMALLRRDSTVLIAVANELTNADLAPASGDAMIATLMRSASPDNIERVAQHGTRAGERFMVRGDIPATPAMIGIEVQSTKPTGPDARMRFGLTPPPALRAMKAGETAISDPVLVDAPKDGAQLSRDPDVVLRAMLGSTHLQGTKQLGVYWETYGFRQTDSVEVTIHVEHQVNPGVFQRAAIAIHLAGDPHESAALSWSEPQPDHVANSLGGIAPIQSRSVTLDITTLKPGVYRLEISVGRKGQTPVTGHRVFAVD